jgi:small subunit ribosomal protein S20
MANTKSSKKAVRSSKRKRSHNLFWEKAVKNNVKTLKASLEHKKDVKELNTELVALQKSLDKAAKEKVIHKNKANRVKSRYAKRIAALQATPARKSTRSTK